MEANAYDQFSVLFWEDNVMLGVVHPSAWADNNRLFEYGRTDFS